MWGTVEEHFDQSDKDLSSIVFSLKRVLIQLTDIERVEQLFQAVFIDAAVQAKLSLPNDPQTGQGDHQYEDYWVSKQRGVLEVLRIPQSDILCRKW